MTRGAATKTVLGIKVFVDEVRKASPNTETVAPRHFEPVVVRPRPGAR